MQNDAVPEWAVNEAERAVEGTMAQASPLFIERVASALVAAEHRGLERAAREIEMGVDRPGIKTKHDKCPHNRYGWDDCEQCCSAHIRKLMEPVLDPQP